MENVVQGGKIVLEVRFYDKVVAEGGVPTDPDNYLHTWDIKNDAGNYVSRIVLLEAGLFPVSETVYYFSIIDSGTDFEVKGYDDAGRTNEIVSTGLLVYGIYADQALNEVGGSGYAGTISITFSGAASEDFEIEDIGPTEPTYEIIDQGNSQVIAPTIFPTRLNVGHFSYEYEVATDATPGENWRLVARGTMDGIDTFVEIYFNVIDSAVVADEVGKLVTLTELKAALEKTSDEDDAMLDTYLLAASKVVEDYCFQLFHQESKTVIFDGNGLTRIAFSGPGPIASITKLEYSSYCGRTWNTVDLDYIAFEEFFITRLDRNVFYAMNSNWRITYIAGYEEAPAQVRRAVIELVRYWYNSKNRPGIKADVIGGGLRTIYEPTKSELPDHVVQILLPLRRLG